MSPSPAIRRGSAAAASGAVAGLGRLRDEPPRTAYRPRPTDGAVRAGARAGDLRPAVRPGPRYCDGVTREGTAEWPITIDADRLQMRAPCDADRHAMIRLLTDPVTREYLGGAVDYASRQALELSPLGLSWGRWAVARRSDDLMIGSITLDYDRGELELSYALLPEFVGFGYAAEACVAVLEWARAHLEDEHVIAVTQTRNKRSVNLLRRLGFTVRRGLEEFGSQQLLLQRSLAEPLPDAAEIGTTGPVRPAIPVR